MERPIIEIRGLVKDFGRVRAVDGLEMEVPGGEIFGLLGPNGAGKTTTLRLLAGLLRPTSGTARVFGLDPRASHPAVATRCGMMIEGPGLHPNLPGRKNLELFAFLKGLARGELDNAVARALDLARLGPACDRPVRTYSSGMKQKVGIAMALMGDPELVILDEPTSGLDPASVVQLRDTLRDMRRERGVTFLLSSHHLAEMETLCTRVAILAKGRILAVRTPEEFLSDEPALYRIKVNDPGSARDAVSGMEGTTLTETSGENLEVFLRPRAVPLLVRFLVDRGFEVAEVRPARSPLEEAYMQLTGDRRP